MMCLAVGSGVRRLSPLRFPYLAKMPIAEAREHGAWLAECDLVSWVAVVSTMGAEVWDSSSPSSTCCYSMASGSLG